MLDYLCCDLILLFFGLFNNIWVFYLKLDLFDEVIFLFEREFYVRGKRDFEDGIIRKSISNEIFKVKSFVY